jgi:hypothetical protein
MPFRSGAPWSMIVCSAVCWNRQILKNSIKICFKTATEMYMLHFASVPETIRRIYSNFWVVSEVQKWEEFCSRRVHARKISGEFVILSSEVLYTTRHPTFRKLVNDVGISFGSCQTTCTLNQNQFASWKTTCTLNQNPFGSCQTTWTLNQNQSGQC